MVGTHRKAALEPCGWGSETELGVRYVVFQAPVAPLRAQILRAVGSMVSWHRSDIWPAVWIQGSSTDGWSGKAEEGETTQEREAPRQHREDPILKGRGKKRSPNV